MANPKLPANQLNALPLQTPEAAADPGEVLTVGGTINKHWTPTVLGISNAPYAIAAAPNGYGSRGFVSNTIDTTLVMFFTIMMMRDLPTVAEAALRTWKLYFQPQFDAGAGGQQFYASLVDGTGGSLREQSLVLIDTIQFHDIAPAFSVGKQVATRSFSLNQQKADIGAGSNAAAGPPGALTTRGRFFIDCNTTLTTPADARVWLDVWAGR